MLLMKVGWENVIVEKLWVAGGVWGGGFNYLKNEMSFYHDIKAFFPLIFEGLAAARNCVRPKSDLFKVLTL